MLCKQDGIFIERPKYDTPIEGCVEALSVRIRVLYGGEAWGYDINDTVPYMIYVENTGTCDLTDVVLTDALGNEINIPSLEQGEVYQMISQYVVTASDIAWQEAYLFVSADSDDAHAQTHQYVPVAFIVNDFDFEIYTQEPIVWTLGTVVTIIAVITNTGNTVWDGVILDLLDSGTGITEETVGRVEPGEQYTITLKHTLNQNDLDVGLSVTAEAIGVDVYDAPNVRWHNEYFYNIN